MSGADFAGRVTAYLGRHLPGVRNLSPNTVASYRDMFKLLIRFFREERGREPERLSMDELDRGAVEDFLDWLDARGCSGTTINQRLCAVKAFVGYVMAEDPARMLQYQRVLAMRQRKAAPRPMVLPGREGLAAILGSPDRGTRRGRRDLALLALLYDSAARVSELCGVALRDLRLDDPATVTLRGKGGRVRVVPLMRRTAALLKGYVEEFHPDRSPARLEEPLFPGRGGGPMTRAGVADVVRRHAERAREAGAPVPEGVTPHSLRHQKAVDLLESGVALVYIRDVLGHRSVTTTEIYATVSVERKRRVLEGAEQAQDPGEYPDWTEDRELMSWLRDLC